MTVLHNFGLKYIPLFIIFVKIIFILVLVQFFLIIQLRYVITFITCYYIHFII